MIGWYRRFIPQCAALAAPLTDLMKKSASNPVVWSDDCKGAFNALKSSLCASPVLQTPDFSKRFLVEVDASGAGLGAVLA